MDVESSNPCGIPLGAEARTALLLARTGAVLTEIGDERLSAVGLTAREYSVLSILSEDGPGSQLELAQLLGKAPALVVAAVDSLEAAGLVERTRDPADRRRSRVTLTKEGQQQLARADVVADRTVAEVLAGLDATELEQLHDLLARGLGLRPGATADAA